MELLTLNNVGVKYDDITALENVHLAVYEDDFLGVIGPNGGGKTTLIKTIINGVKYSGAIRYGDLLKGSYGYKIGYLPQQNDFDVKFPISVEEVVLSGLQQTHGLLRPYTKYDKQKARQLLKQMGIGEISLKPIGKISGGQMQRALLCRSIISDPKLLILDEPANFVDNKFEKELYELLQELNKSMAIIMVSHDIGTITSVVKNIVCVNKHVHRHQSNKITADQLRNYDCPMQLITHGEVPHTVLQKH